MHCHSPFFKIIQRPMATKSKPPPIVRNLGLINLSSNEPARTPTKVAAISAREADAKTVKGALEVAEKERTPSWVLSPNSERKIAPKVTQKRFQSILFPNSVAHIDNTYRGYEPHDQRDDHRGENL